MTKALGKHPRILFYTLLVSIFVLTGGAGKKWAF
jgi:hypothetical protein